MLEENRKKKILERNYYLNKRSDARKKNRFLTAKHRYFLTAVLIGLFLFGLAYFMSDLSDVYRISIKGNNYLKDSEILRLSGLSTHDKFLLASTSKAERSLRTSPFIEDVEVRKENDRIISITVNEKKIAGYSYDNGSAVLVMGDGSKIPMDLSNMYLIDRIPLISGFTAEQLEYILMGFKNIDNETINEISEIHRYPFSYDENMMEVVMRDGNYVFSSTFGLKMLKSYYSVISSLNLHGENVCIYMDEVTNSGYASACPWEDRKEEKKTEEGKEVSGEDTDVPVNEE